MCQVNDFGGDFLDSLVDVSTSIAGLEEEDAKWIGVLMRGVCLDCENLETRVTKQTKRRSAYEGWVFQEHRC